MATLNKAVYSNRKTFQFCQKWLQLAVLEDHAAFKGLPVSVLMATDHELDDFDKNVLIKGIFDIFYIEIGLSYIENYHRKPHLWYI